MSHFWLFCAVLTYSPICNGPDNLQHNSWTTVIELFVLVYLKDMGVQPDTRRLTAPKRVLLRASHTTVDDA